MSCNIDIENKIFSIQKMKRSDKNNYIIQEYCVFVGNLDEQIQKILEN